MFFFNDSNKVNNHQTCLSLLLNLLNIILLLKLYYRQITYLFKFIVLLINQLINKLFLFYIIIRSLLINLLEMKKKRKERTKMI